MLTGCNELHAIDKLWIKSNDRRSSMREIGNSGYKENISQNIKFYGLCEPKS